MKILFTIAIILNTIRLFAQNTPIANIPHAQNKTAGKDTGNKEPRYFYLSANTNVFVDSKGSFAKRFSPSFEFGRTYGIFEIGLASGWLNFLSSGSDTTRYLEFRPTINIFSKGRFAEALCLGGGYVFKAKQGLMTEVCNSINFNISETVAIAVVQGYYYFDGTNSSRSALFMGCNITYNFLKKNSINLERKKAIISDN